MEERGVAGLASGLYIEEPESERRHRASALEVHVVSLTPVTVAGDRSPASPAVL